MRSSKPWWCYVCNVGWHPWAVAFKLALAAIGWYWYGWWVVLLVGLATIDLTWRK